MERLGWVRSKDFFFIEVRGKVGVWLKMRELGYFLVGRGGEFKWMFFVFFMK